MSYVFWAASIFAVGFACLALQSSSKSRAVFFLWISGLALSGVMFSMRAEFLGWAQAVVTTLSCGVLVLHSVLNGEGASVIASGFERKRISLIFIAVALVSGLLGVFWFSLIHGRIIPTFSSGLKALGTQMTEGPFFLALIVIILGSFLMLVGASIISRAEDDRGQR